MHIAPIIKTPPMDQVHIASPGLKVSFICTVDGGIGSLFEILWSGPVVDLPNATLVEVGSGVFTSNLTLTNVTSDFSGIYECTTRYNNSLCGTTNTSSNASLVLLGPQILTDQTESPLKIDCSDNTTFYFEFSGLPSLTDVECIGPRGDKISDNITLGNTLDRMDNDTEFQIRLSINITLVNNAHGGMYLCTASNSAGNITATVLLQVLQCHRRGT